MDVTCTITVIKAFKPGLHGVAVNDTGAEIIRQTVGKHAGLTACRLADDDKGLALLTYRTAVVTLVFLAVDKHGAAVLGIQQVVGVLHLLFVGNSQTVRNGLNTRVGFPYLRNGFQLFQRYHSTVPCGCRDIREVRMRPLGKVGEMTPFLVQRTDKLRKVRLSLIRGIGRVVLGVQTLRTLLVTPPSRLRLHFHRARRFSGGLAVHFIGISADACVLSEQIARKQPGLLLLDLLGLLLYLVLLNHLLGLRDGIDHLAGLLVEVIHIKLSHGIVVIHL